MRGMFSGCSGLSELNLSSFDTSNVEVMYEMFENCSSLTSLDLSSYDTSKVRNIYNMFDGCYMLDTIYTPYNLTESVPLSASSTDTWYRSDGTIATELPQNLHYSVTLGKNQIREEKLTELDGITIDKVEIASNITVTKGKSAVRIIDGKTSEPISLARILVDGEHWTDENGMVELSRTGLTTIQIEKEGYHKKSVQKNLHGGQCSTIILCPDTGDMQILSAVLNLSGEDEDVLDHTAYLIHRDLDNVTEGFDTEFTLRVEAAGKPVKYQLIQNGKLIQESGDGTFKLTGKYVNGKDGTVSYYVEDLSAGYQVSVKVIDGERKALTQKLGIKVSEASTTLQKVKEMENKGKVEIGEKLKVTVPSDIPLVGGSELEFGFQEKLPIVIDIDNKDNKVKIALNKNMFDTSSKQEWADIKREYENLSKKALKASNAAAAFGGEPVSFGAGLVSFDGSIMGYGEGYLDDSSDQLRVNVGVVVTVKGEAKHTQYFYIGTVPVYLKVKYGVSLTVKGELNASMGKSGLIMGGSVDMEPSVYGTITAGAGIDGMLSADVSGTMTYTWLHRFSNNYNRVSLNGNVKAKKTVFFLSQEKTLLDKTWVLYDSNKKSTGNVEQTGKSGISYLDMSGAKPVSMDYLSKRLEGTGSTGIMAYPATGAESQDSVRILDYAYEAAEPRLVKTEDKWYLFYLDGVAGRSIQNQTALFYRSSSDNGVTWSEALRADDGVNETADYDFDIAVNGNDIYVIWSDAGEVYGDEILSMDSSEALAKVGKEMNLMIAVIDGSTGVVQSTTTLGTQDADMQPQAAVGSDGTVYAAWITNDVSSESGLLSNENQMGICYASSKDNFVVHRSLLTEGNYPLTLDAGMLSSEICVAADLDVDGDLNTQTDWEIYALNLETGGELSAQTANNVVDSVPQFGRLEGQDCLFWYQDGNIAYTADGQNVSYVFDSENLPSIGQEFSLLEGSDGKAAIVWTTTSLTEDTGVDMYCTDFDGNVWSNAYRLGEVDSEYTVSPSGYLDGSSYWMVYLGSGYENDELCSHIYMYTPSERIDTSVVWNPEADGTPGEEYTLHMTVTNNGNKEVSSLAIMSEDKSIRETIAGFSIAPGTTQEIIWSGITLPEDMTEIYTHELMVWAQGEADTTDNVFELSVGAPDFSVEADLDYSSGEQFVSVLVTNSGILPSDAVLHVYKDEAHAEELYQTDLQNLAGGESRVTVFDLTVMDRTAQTFYFVVSDANGTELYTGDNESILYAGKGIYLEYKEREPVVTSISVKKTKTSYEYGDILNTDDLKVTLHYDDGMSKETNDYSTNAGSINMCMLGKKSLTVTYGDKTAEVELTIEPCMLNGKTTVVLPYQSCVYDGTAKKPVPTSVSVNGVKLIMGTDYTVTWGNNVNTGEGVVYIVGLNNYRGNITSTFTITAKGSSVTEKPEATEKTAPSKGTTLKSGKNTYKVTKAGATVAFTKTTSTAATVKIDSTVKIDGITYKITSISANAFKGNKKVKTVTIGSNVTSIGKNAFYGCTKLKTVTIGSKVTSIGTGAFKNCTALTKIKIPNKVTSIGNLAFGGCKKLTTVTIGTGLKKIGKSAFSGCVKLSSVTIKSKKLSSVGKNAFKGIKSTAKLKVPAKKLKAYQKLLKNKGQGRKVKIIK